MIEGTVQHAILLLLMEIIDFFLLKSNTMVELGELFLYGPVSKMK